MPLLPDPGDFRVQLERALSAEGAAGAVALVDGEVAAHLIASPQDDGSNEVGLAGCAAREPELIGHVLMYRRNGGDLRIPEGSIDLALATMHSDVRGSGVGRALIAHALRWAHEQGYRALTIDWRVVNLLADRFFNARGFRPTFLRLYRHVP